MKFHKIVAIMLILLTALACLPVSAAQERKLTLDRVVQINDTQMILEFSEPVAINLEQENRGPYCCIRLVNSAGNFVRANREDVLSPHYNVVLQWQGFLQFIDEKHDRMIWTISQNTCGINNINDIVNYAGALSKYTDRRVAFTIEEVPYNTGVVNANFRIDNVTTADGEVHLFPTYFSGWERVTMPFTQDFSYKVDEAGFEGIDNPVKIESGLIEKGEYVDPEPTATTVEVVQNNPLLVGAILCGCVVLGVMLIVLAIVRKKRKAA